MERLRKLIEILKHFYRYPIFFSKTVFKYLGSVISGRTKHVPSEDIKVKVGKYTLIGNPSQSSIFRKLYTRGFHEFFPTGIVKQYVKPGNVCLDIGADKGYFSILMATAMNNSGKVFAFEPMDSTYKTLEKNIRINGLETLVTTKKIALFSENKIVNMDPSSYSLLNEKEGNSISMKCQKFDDMLDNLEISRIDFIKIDIEGAEIDCLIGMEESIKKYHPKLLIEVHQSLLHRLNRKPSDLKYFLNQNGYKYNSNFPKNNKDFHLFCK